MSSGTVSNQIMSALRGGIRNNGVTLKYVFDHSATKNKHIIKKEEDGLDEDSLLDNVPF